MRTTNMVGCIDHPSVRFVPVKGTTVLTTRRYQFSGPVEPYIGLDLARVDGKCQRVLMTVEEAKSVLARLQKCIEQTETPGAPNQYLEDGYGQQHDV